jgi:drug/metabolite transporter (DMT)-like permease
VFFAAANVGYLAGLSVSALWTVTSLFFTAAGRRIGPTMVNAVRIATAVALHTVTHRLLTGRWVPDAHSRQVLFLAASGVMGLTIGDQAIISAFVTVGPRLALLVMTTAPLMAAGFGMAFLAESLPSSAWLGIVLTISGVAWVILERGHASESAADRSRRLRGCFYAFIAAACQAGGLLLSKQGMGHGWLPREEHLPPQTATLIRMTFAGFGMAPLLAWRAFQRRVPLGESDTASQPVSPADANPPHDGLAPSPYRTGVILACLGAVTGPFLGVWMSLVASDRVPLGVAQTLCSLPPVLILPFAAIVYRERLTVRAVAGAALAVLGVALLFRAH